MHNRILIGLVTAALTHAIYGEVLPSSVKHAPPSNVQLDQTFFGYGLGEHSEARLFIDAPGPGLLALEVSAPAHLENTLWIDFSPPSRGAEEKKPDLHVLSRSFNRQIVAIPAAGAYLLRIGNVWNETPIGDYFITTRFLDSTTIKGSDWIGNKDGGDIEESDNEIVPLIVPDPIDAKHLPADKSLLDLDVLPWCPSSGPEVNLWLCARRAVVGEVLAGALDPAVDGDWDGYTFTLEKTARVRLESRGDTDTFGSLYDQHGGRLMGADGGGEGENFALSPVLVPGRYFVRVEGTWGASGPYTLTVVTSDP